MSPYLRMSAAVLFVLVSMTSPCPAASGSAGVIRETLLSLASKPFVVGEDRPRSDGRLDKEAIRAELLALALHVPEWRRAMLLESVDERHLHSIGEHGLRAFFHYVRTGQARALPATGRRWYVCALTVLLHDMGKLHSPRDPATNRQVSDPDHGVHCAAYIRRHGEALGLTPQETLWSARMLRHHRDLGMLQRAKRVPGFATADELERMKAELARTAQDREGLEFLAAMTESDVLAINESAYDDWRLSEYLPWAVDAVGSLLPR